MVEKRNSERTNIGVEITGLLVVDNTFSLVDVSDGGALIRIPQKLTFGNLYQLKFEFVNKGVPITLKMKSKVVREKLFGFAKGVDNEKVSIYEVGLSFFDVSKEDVKNLKFLIAHEEIKKKK